MPDMKIKYLPGAHRLKRIAQGDWIDLYAYEDCDFKAGEFKLVSLGFAAQLPQGYEANIVPRSSTFKKYGLIQTNCYAVIDNDFNGDADVWLWPAYATRDVYIPKDTRLCQFRINPVQPKFKIVEVDTLGNSDRGGFGSTGA